MIGSYYCSIGSVVTILNAVTQNHRLVLPHEEENESYVIPYFLCINFAGAVIYFRYTSSYLALNNVPEQLLTLNISTCDFHRFWRHHISKHTTKTGAQN